MTTQRRRWRELFRGEDPILVQAVATSIEAMEYDVRIVDARSRTVIAPDEPFPGRAVLAIETRHDHWPDLAGVLDQIVEEQRAFDDYLDARNERVMHHERVLIGVMAVVITILTVLGLIKA